MNFSFGKGSLGKYWGAFSKNFQLGDKKMFGGELGKFSSTFGQGRDYLASMPGMGGTTKDILAGKYGDDSGLTKGLKNLDRSTMGWSRQLSPLWEGGLSGTGGSLHQDLLPWMEETSMKASHHLMGTGVDGYGQDGKSSRGSGSALVASNAEDPSMINQGNWQRPGTMQSFARRENELNRGGLATDLTKTKRGRQSVANLS